MLCDTLRGGQSARLTSVDSCRYRVADDTDDIRTSRVLLVEEFARRASQLQE